MCGLKPGVQRYKLLQLLCVSRGSLGKIHSLKNHSTVKQSNVCIKWSFSTTFLAKAAINKTDAFLESLWNLGKTQNSFCLELLFLKLCFIQSFLSSVSPACFLARVCADEPRLLLSVRGGTAPVRLAFSVSPFARGKPHSKAGELEPRQWGRSAVTAWASRRSCCCLCPLFFLGKGQKCLYLLTVKPQDSAVTCMQSHLQTVCITGEQKCVFFKPQADL